MAKYIKFTKEELERHDMAKEEIFLSLISSKIIDLIGRCVLWKLKKDEVSFSRTINTICDQYVNDKALPRIIQQEVYKYFYSIFSEDLESQKQILRGNLEGALLATLYDLRRSSLLP